PFPVKKRSRTPWKGWAATAAVVAVVVLGAAVLPGQLGAGFSKSADSAATSFAQAESNGIAADRSVPESVMDADSPTADELKEAPTALEDGSPKFYTATALAGTCGTITLTGEALPAGLEGYAYAENAEGNRTYEVPADFFFACLKTLETEQPDSFSYEAGQEDGGYGLIIVEALP
ncbi:MAG: hypothetical protein ACI4O3_06115, partial [Oscillospiraceae bacterium]